LNPTPTPSSVPLAKIRPGDNPRRYFDPKKHEDLVAGIRQRGLLQPLLLRPAPDAADIFLIVAGGRRYRAAMEVFGTDGEVPAIVRDMTEQEALEAAIDENDNRADASETEQADAAVRVLAACQDDRAEAARRLGWSTSKLDRRLALAELSDTVKVALDERRIKVGHAELLAAVPKDKQERALENILTAGLDVGQTRAALMRMTQDLGAAAFDKTDCTTCPYNSASQRALFETHVDDGHCTSPGCFQLKVEGHEAAKREAAEREAEVANTAAPAVEQVAAPSTPAPAPAPAAAAKPAPSASASKTNVTAKTIAVRARTAREAAWRSAVSRALIGDLHLNEKSQLGLRAFACSVITLGDDFTHVATLARALEVDLRDTWVVDKAFLDRFDKDELKIIAMECGLVAHMGEKVFARLLKSRTTDIIAGMLKATGFDWSRRLPSSMTLDGKYGAPPAPPVVEAEPAAA